MNLNKESAFSKSRVMGRKGGEKLEAQEVGIQNRNDSGKLD